MSPLRLSRSDRILLGVLVPLALVGAFVVSAMTPDEPTGGVFGQPSTFFTASHGLKAAYQTLGRLGYPVERLRNAPSRGRLAGVRTLFVLGPVTKMNPAIQRTLLDWVAAGRVLVVSPGLMETFREWIDIADVDRGVRATGERLDRNDPLMQGIEHLFMRPGIGNTLGGPAKGPLEHAETSHFWTDSRGTLGLTLSHGSGFIVALADAYPLTNAGLLEADNAVLLGNLARLRTVPEATGGLAFDEYHLGFNESDSSPVAMAKLVLEGHWRPAILQALAVALLALLAGSVRFGSPIIFEPVRRRQHAEFAEAAGKLLYDARAGELVLSKLHAHFRARALRMVHLPATAGDDQLEAEISRRTGLDARALLGPVHTGTGATTPKNVLQGARVLYRILRALEHGAR